MKRFIFLMLMGLSFGCFADSNERTLGESVTEANYFIVECSDDSDRMYFEISSLIKKPLLSAQIFKGNFATNIPANNGGVEILQGGGNYKIVVSKNGVGTIDYSFEYHCANKDGHAGTKITQLQ
jgi:hypothetical protein